jgi:hypothetical protein
VTNLSRSDLAGLQTIATRTHATTTRRTREARFDGTGRARTTFVNGSIAVVIEPVTEALRYLDDFWRAAAFDI